ncbi:MAG TPA: STAS domain-containing protein [Bryobacteraceae bacterium]|nr:STAS domain-containing protein [Bryobacteraceae bacterium]
MTVSPTKTKVEQNADLAVMRFEGDITSASEQAVLGKYRGLNAPTKKILLDFSKVSYLNSSGIAIVIQLLVAANNASQKVVCFGLSAHFVKVFTMLGLSKYTSLHGDETAARAAVV